MAAKNPNDSFAGKTPFLAAHVRRAIGAAQAKPAATGDGLAATLPGPPAAAHVRAAVGGGQAPKLPTPKVPTPKLANPSVQAKAASGPPAPAGRPAAARPAVPALAVRPVVAASAAAAPGSRVVPRQTLVVQRALAFDSRVHAQWIPDKANCQLCREPIGFWKGRHHCRVCGRSVCGICASTKYQVAHRITSSGRQAGPGTSSERVCVDCVLQRKMALAAGVLEYAQLAAAAQAGAGRAIALDWERFDGRGRYSPHHAMITLDPRNADAFSTYIFELTNAAQSGRFRRPADFDDPEKYAFYVELTEYNGTRSHQRVARALNNAHLGFAVQEMFPQNLPDFTSFNRHYEVQQDEHTERYREQWRDAMPAPAPRRGSFSKEKGPKGTKPRSGSVS